MHSLVCSFPNVPEGFHGWFSGYQHIRMYDLNSNNPNPVINYDGVSKNITSVGFHDDGRWMYTGGEDCMARIWDLRYQQIFVSLLFTFVMSFFPPLC